MAVKKPLVQYGGLFQEITAGDSLKVDAGSFKISGAFVGTFTFTATTAVTFPTSGTLATRAGTETLSSKTLDNPQITNGVTVLAGSSGFAVSGGGISFYESIAGSPSSTNFWINHGNIAGRKFSIETSSSADVVFDIDSAGGTYIFPAAGTLANLASAQTLTNKTISFASNTLSGTIAQFNSAVTDADLAILGANTFTGTQNLGGNILKGVKNAAVDGTDATSGTTGAVTIDWTSGCIAAQAELTGAITYTFTAPADSNQWLTIMGASDGTSTAYGITWPASVIWYGTAFSTTTVNKKWIVRFFWDGTNYHAFGASQV